MNILGQFTSKDYVIDGVKCNVLLDFEEDTIRITTHNQNITYALLDYEDFEGNMLDFIKSKIS